MHWHEFRKIFQDACHVPFQNVILIQGIRPGKQGFRWNTNAPGGYETYMKKPDDFEAMVVLKKYYWIKDTDAMNIAFKIRRDGSIFCDSPLEEPKEKWEKLIRTWVDSSVSECRAYKRTNQIKEELVSTVFYKQMEKAQLCTEIYG